MSRKTLALLRDLAGAYGIQTSYVDVERRRQPASDESLFAALRSIGASVHTLGDVIGALRQKCISDWERPLQPVIVCWEGNLPPVEVRVPSALFEARLVVEIDFEDGEHQQWILDASTSPVVMSEAIDGRFFLAKEINVDRDIPLGYHRLTVEAGGSRTESLLVSAPRRAYNPSYGESVYRNWGVFVPLYALHSNQSWQSGDVSDLRKLIEWVREMGGQMVGTLPLLATFPEQESPYEPATRLLWNEFYCNIESIPELAGCSTARTMLDSEAFREEIRLLRESPLIKYQRERSLRKLVMEELCRCCHEDLPGRRQELEAFAKSHAMVADYARFRATLEKQQRPWQQWPGRLREGVLNEGDYDPDRQRYYMYVQWLIHEQMEGLLEDAARQSMGLYLDFPLGVDPEGYDTWRYQNAFALDASGGAPPDAVFSGGQNWGFPPLHPEQLRRQGYSYYIACLRHHLRRKGILRLDHVMFVHRLYWIPKGMGARDGVYVRYADDEFYAITNLESHRHECCVVGENLGTVPAYINRALKERGINRMHVLQYELAMENSRRPGLSVPSNAAASLNTHDMPTFAGFWQGVDIEQRLSLGLLNESGKQEEQLQRRKMKSDLIEVLQKKRFLHGTSFGVSEVLNGTLAFLGASGARMVVVNLEDLWLEEEPQNIPGGGSIYPNWKRRARYSLEEFRDKPGVRDILRSVDRNRKRRRDQEDDRTKRPDVAAD